MIQSYRIDQPDFSMAGEEFQLPPAGVDLAHADIHVWRASLDHSDCTVQKFESYRTRKEAFSKLTGNGLRQAVEKLDVTLPLRKPAYTPKSIFTSKAPCRFSIRDLHPRPGFAAAIAAVRKLGRILCWQWQF